MPPLPRTAFQVIALFSLALPIGVTWALSPLAISRLGLSGASLEVRALIVVLVLLVAVLGWALLVMPLRRLTDLPKLSDELAAVRDGGLAPAYRRARSELEQARRSPLGRDRRRYHLNMAAGALAVAAVGGLITWLMWAGSSGVIFLAFPVAAAVGLALAPYHLARALLARDKRPER